MMATCDYEPTTNQFHLDRSGRGMVAGGMRARPVRVGGAVVVEGYATRQFCSRTHLDLAERGALSTTGGSVDELRHFPLLADGRTVGE
jgi:hypothetical protein